MLLVQLILSLVILGSAAAVTGFTWNKSHVFNSEWHPHARFHAAHLTGFANALALLGLWFLWQSFSAPFLVASVIATTAICFWGAEFFAFFIPGTSPSPNPAKPNTFRLFGFKVYGNLFFSGVMIVLSLLSVFLAGAAG